MKNCLKDKIAVVSGATSGIGKAIAETLQSQGVKIVNISKDTSSNDYFKNYLCDISDDVQLLSVAEDIKQNYEVDFLFCNAGFGIGGSVESAAIDDIDKLFNVNLIAHVKMTKLLIPSIKHGGKIFYTGSLASVIPLPFQACYSASKAALENFSRALATELKPRGIKVCTILPGDIATHFTDARVTPNHCTAREQHSIAKMEKAERTGKSPSVVGKLVLKLAKRKNLPLHVTVGFGNKILVVLVKFLPMRLVNFLVEKIYI